MLATGSNVAFLEGRQRSSCCSDDPASVRWLDMAVKRRRILSVAICKPVEDVAQFCPPRKWVCVALLCAP